MENKNETLNALRMGACSLVYVKLNGDVRVATGTLNKDLIPKESQPKTKVEKPEEIISYYDLDSQGWRCFWLENLRSLKVNETEVDANGFNHNYEDNH
jgi:hypothetical protein